MTSRRLGVSPYSFKDTMRPVASSAAASRRMSLQVTKNTKPELALRRRLHALGLRYRVQVAIPGTRRRADVVFGPAKVAVFVDGDFWHGCPEHMTWPKANAVWWREKIERNRRRDADTDARLRAAGWLPIRVWEHESPDKAAKRIALAVSRRRNENGT